MLGFRRRGKASPVMPRGAALQNCARKRTPRSEASRHHSLDFRIALIGQSRAHLRIVRRTGSAAGEEDHNVLLVALVFVRAVARL